jgi:Protein of unknown function (DUF1524)
MAGRFVGSIGAAALMAMLSMFAVPRPADAATTTARKLAIALVTKAEAGSTTYSRDYFKHWIDANGDCQNTRAEVLITESRVPPTYTTTRRCTVATGRWVSWYDGATWTNASDVDIEHKVPLKEAWESGARGWTATNRQRFANDLGHPWALAAITDNVNSSKGARDPAEWLPPVSSVHCTYAIHWVTIKYRWRLTVDSTERAALLDILSLSCGAKTVTIPARAI